MSSRRHLIFTIPFILLLTSIFISYTFSQEISDRFQKLRDRFKKIEFKDGKPVDMLGETKKEESPKRKVKKEESPEELPPGQMPRSVDVVLKGDIVDISRPGDMVKVTGLLQTAPDFSRRGGKLATFRVFIDANGVEIAEKEYELEISDEDEKEILELSLAGRGQLGTSTCARRRPT